MSKTYFGLAGKYEIYNDSCIVLQKFNNDKNLSSKYKIYNNPDSIPDHSDKVLVKKIIDSEFLK